MSSRLVHSDLSDLFNYGIDTRNRIIHFGMIEKHNDYMDWSNAFTPINITAVVRAIQYMAAQNKNPISIYMNSTGGDPYSMLFLIDIILNTPCQFKFYGGGAIMSAATWVMAVCDERYLFPNTRVMIHAGGLDTEYLSLTDFKILTDEQHELRRLLEKMYAENSKMPQSFWEEACKRDLYLTAEEAVYLGLADAIVSNPDRTAFRKLRQKHLSTPLNESELKEVIRRLYSRIYTNHNPLEVLQKTQVALLQQEEPQQRVCGSKPETSVKKRSRKKTSKSKV